MVAIYLLGDLKQYCQELTQSVKRHSNKHISLACSAVTFPSKAKLWFRLVFCKWKDNGIFNGSEKILKTIFYIWSVCRDATTCSLQWGNFLSSQKTDPSPVEQNTINTIASSPIFHHFLRDLKCCNKTALFVKTVFCLGMEYVICSVIGA